MASPLAAAQWMAGRGAPVSGRALEAMTVDREDGADESAPQTWRTTLRAATRVLAVRPSFDRAYASVHLWAALPSGRTIPLLQLRAAQPQWYRRYWLTEPVELPAGATIEGLATPAPKDDFGVATTARYPLQIALDVVSP